MDFCSRCLIEMNADSTSSSENIIHFHNISKGLFNGMPCKALLCDECRKDLIAFIFPNPVERKRLRVRHEQLKGKMLGELVKEKEEVLNGKLNN